MSQRNGKSLVAYYSIGRLVGVQVVGLIYVSDNYWLDSSKSHGATLKGMTSVATMTVALDVLEAIYWEYMEDIA